jgi:hypothetical protein
MTDHNNLHDSFLKISFEEVDSEDTQQANKGHGHKDQAYTEWKDELSHKATDPGLYFTNVLRKKYPGRSIVRVMAPYAFPLQSFPEIVTRVCQHSTQVAPTPLNRDSPFQIRLWIPV